MNSSIYKLFSGAGVLIIPHIDITQDGHPILVHRYDVFNYTPKGLNNHLSEKNASPEDSKE